MINDGEIAIIVILGINFLIFVVLIGYVYIKIRPMFEKLDRFTRMIIVMVFVSMGFQIISYLLTLISQNKSDDPWIKDENAAMRNTRIATMFAASVGYSLVFDLFVFRMLYRMDLQKNFFARRRHGVTANQNNQLALNFSVPEGVRTTNKNDEFG